VAGERSKRRREEERKRETIQAAKMRCLRTVKG
jgi:hypothetical protein